MSVVMSGRTLASSLPQAKRGQDSSKRVAGARPSQLAKISSSQEQAVQATGLDNATEDLLRRFDLTAKYGPCTGLTRLERWQRSAALGLNPPTDVKAALERLQHVGKVQQSVWAGNV